MRVFHHIRLTPLNVLATCSIFGLLIVAGLRIVPSAHPVDRVVTQSDTPSDTGRVADGTTWQEELARLGLTASSTPEDKDPISLISPQVLGLLAGNYQNLQQSGTYSSFTVAEATDRIAPYVKADVPYVVYTPADIATDPDSSYERMLVYKNDMREALKPLLLNIRAEYEIYADYTATGDINYLKELRVVASHYSDAASTSAQIIAPADVAQTHLDTVNALAHFSATLNAMAAHADDPIASVALLRTYNSSELAVVNSFDRLAKYQRLKQP